MRHLISLKKQTKEDILTMLRLAKNIKTKRNAGELTNYLPNKTLVMLFEKTSTRTRLSFEAAMTELGGHAIFLDRRTTQCALTELTDEIQAVMRYGQMLMYRAKKVTDVMLAASYNRIPVIDACSEKYHPAQALSDMLTMIEYSGGRENIQKVVWMGIEDNVMNSLMIVCAKLGIHFTIISPKKDESSLDPELESIAKSTGLVERTLSLEQGLKGADYVHTDTWMNMEFFDANGRVIPEQYAVYEKRKKILLPYQVNANLINTYCKKAKIMHCMPLHIGYEITRDAMDHPNSIVLDQAENRLHMQKGILMWLLEQENII